MTEDEIRQSVLPRLVQLHTIPQDQWLGRAVFHPMIQQGTNAYWNPTHAPYPLYDPNEEDEEDKLCFDAGMVVHFEPSDWRGEPDDLATWEVKFMAGSGTIWSYGAWTLWTLPLGERVD